MDFYQMQETRPDPGSLRIPVRENRMHGLMREGRREPVLYSTQISQFAAKPFIQRLDALGFLFVGRVQRIQIFSVGKFKAPVFQSAQIRSETIPKCDIFNL